MNSSLPNGDSTVKFLLESDSLREFLAFLLDKSFPELEPSASIYLDISLCSEGFLYICFVLCLILSCVVGLPLLYMLSGIIVATSLIYTNFSSQWSRLVYIYL